MTQENPGGGLLTKRIDEILHPFLPSVGGGTVEVELTVEGRVEARDRYQAIPIKGNVVLFNGFGPFNRYPAALADTRVIEVRIRELKPPPKSPK